MADSTDKQKLKLAIKAAFFNRISKWLESNPSFKNRFFHDRTNIFFRAGN